jgi:hypothetical protein
VTRERQIEIADWIVDTCLTFGTSVNTAYHVAAYFVEACETGGVDVPGGESVAPAETTR